MAPRIRGRPARTIIPTLSPLLYTLTITDTPGPTYLSYTPDGTKLITVGLNNAIRVFHTGSDAEPTTIDNCQESNTAVAAAVRFSPLSSERKLTLGRTISSLPAAKMALYANTLWRQTPSRKSSRDAHYPFEMLHFRQTDTGWQWLASMSRNPTRICPALNDAVNFM